MKLKTIVCLLPMVALVSGCSISMKKYEASSENVFLLQQVVQEPVAVEHITNVGSRVIKIRGAKFVSPYSKDFGLYLEEALKLELVLADKYGADSDLHIGGQLVDHDMDSVTGEGHVTADFYVKKNASEIFRKRVTGTGNWEVFYTGFQTENVIVKSYRSMIANMLHELYKDPGFQEAMQVKK